MTRIRRYEAKKGVLTPFQSRYYAFLQAQRVVHVLCYGLHRLLSVRLSIRLSVSLMVTIIYNNFVPQSKEEMITLLNI